MVVLLIVVVCMMVAHNCCNRHDLLHCGVLFSNQHSTPRCRRRDGINALYSTVLCILSAVLISATVGRVERTGSIDGKRVNRLEER